MNDYTTIFTPIGHIENLTKDNGVTEVDVHTYRSMVGSSMFLKNSRPNICHVVLLMSKYMNASSNIHLKIAKRI